MFLGEKKMKNMKNMIKLLLIIIAIVGLTLIFTKYSNFANNNISFSLVSAKFILNYSMLFNTFSCIVNC